jgi:type II secretory pathway pseudopilin PulG
MRLIRTQEGFTMITTMLMLFVVGILTVAAVAAANGDIRFSRYDQDDKAAYSAAEAGINDYLAHLQQDSDYWTRCAGEDAVNKPLGAGNAVNEQFTGTPPAGRKWRDVSGSTSEYSIELIPAPGKTTCSTTDPPGSMIDDGNFRIRSTGHVKGTKNYKSVVATFRRTGFLDFLYFTDFENQDPTYITLLAGDTTTRATTSSGVPTGGPDLVTWAATNCDRHWWGTLAKPGQGRQQSPTWHGQFLYGSTWSDDFDLTTAYVCGEITFASDDQVNGPFHSNDDILAGGSPDFGRTGNKDHVEVANLGGSDVGWRGSATPNFRTPNGKLTTGANTLSLPPGNTAIKDQAQAGYLYTGPTTIVINSNNTMNVTNDGTTTNGVALPANGVIYVQNSSCTYGYKPTDTQNIDDGCGVAQVSGTYNKDLTIAAEDDVIVMNNLQRLSGSNAVLGLVANNFVRVWHPVTPSPRSGGSCTNSTNPVSPTNIKIDAAILSLKHSFTVDNYDCGAALGNLTVNGAIAQKHRGIVGTSGGTGYIKNYNYDDRLKYRSPPYFLDPVQASWRVLRENDQSGAR